MTTSIFLGIDQTGALKKPGGDPKPLPASWIIVEEDEARLEVSMLESLRWSTLSKLSSSKAAKIEILADCVFGLPRGTRRQSVFKDELRAAAEFRRLHGLGRSAAELFFKERYHSVYEAAERMKPNSLQFPQRECEVRAAANSVFRSRPYQKNIQTGSFRIWAELGADLEAADDWFSLWAHEPLKKVPLGEGYPSHSWKVVTGFSKREPDLVFKFLTSKFKSLKLPSSHQQKSFTADQADAVVLAVHLWSSGGFRKKKVHPKAGEGWIFGLE